MRDPVERVRPKMMTVVAIMAGLLPMIGGMMSSTLLTLIVIPAICGLVKEATLKSADRVMEAATI